MTILSHVRRVVRREKQERVERKEREKPGTEVRKPKGELKKEQGNQNGWIVQRRVTGEGQFSPWTRVEYAIQEGPVTS